MRVTKAIRDWIEQQVSNRYDPVIENIGTDYEQEQKGVIAGLNVILERANEEARRYLADKGFSVCSCQSSYRRVDDNWRHNVHFFTYMPDPNKEVFTLVNTPHNASKINEITKRKNNLSEQKENMIKKIAFDLEVGETDKEQLKAIIDAIAVEG